MQVDIRSFNEWMAEDRQRGQSSWLLLGKGPSFKQLDRLDSSGLLRFGLNHVVRDTRLEVFHCIDIEVVEQCGDSIIENAAIAVLPWAPHVRRRLLRWSRYEEFLPSGLSLQQHLEHSPVLRRLAEQDRLFWYNLRSAPRRLRRPGMPITPVRGFSASAAVALLAQQGVKRIRTLGIDGGRRYAGEFHDLNKKTLLAAGQASFDSQFEPLADSIYRSGLDFGPLDHPLPARVAIATGPRLPIPAKVMAHALRRRTSLSIDFTQEPARAEPGCRIQAAKEQPNTLPRAIRPAIRFDASCLLEADLRVTWLDKDLSAPTCVSCWPATGPQPWLHTDAKDGWLWCSALIDAHDAGAISRTEVAAAVTAGQLRASLLVQLDSHLREPMLLPRKLWARDRFSQAGGERPNRFDRLHHPGQLGAAFMRHLGERVYWEKWRRYPPIIVDKLGKVLRGLF